MDDRDGVERMCDANQFETIRRRIVNKATSEFEDRLDRVLLYDSYARGEYDNESDIDTMILADISVDEAARHEEALVSFTTKLDLEFDVVVSLYVKDKSTFDKWGSVLPFYKNVVKEGISLIA
jgi:predicted nucleotidyltransferase